MAATALLIALGYKPPPPTLSAAPQRLCDLKFVNPATVFDVRRNLGVAPARSVFERFSMRFRAADIAFLAAGASSDGKHIPPTDDFHPDFDEFYAATSGENGNAMRQAFRSELETLLHDLATVWDRTTGGTTVILHADGTVAPKTKIVPECLRASVYIPPSFIAQHPDSHLAIAHLAQHFIEHFVTRTVSRWTELAQLRWSLDQPGRGTRNPPDPPLIPQPKSCRRAKYLFFGRPVGSLVHLPLPPAHPALPLAIIDISDLDESDDHDLGAHALHSRATAACPTARNRPHGASTTLSPALVRASMSSTSSSPQPGRSRQRISAPPPYSPAELSHVPTARDLEAAITLLDLAQHRAVIRLVVLNFPLLVWQEKLVESGVPEEAAHVLCEVLTEVE
ncbi:hypothetical protein B0H19DRAFT_1275471 [Mycena capillaripes]|nr:hypothetical protein B0H19DRAFT_1275471 [Mycena capillaripes]